MPFLFTKKEFTALMRISVSQLLLVCLLVNMALADPLLAQEKLQEKVSISLKNTTLKALLNVIEQKTEIVFSYRKDVIK
ncbi:hypothetical protein, partial [Arsenicibacter rosenii]|uniref:hypothetical protein n=1 Tax=Arsenicibacter rosenii TaxID=1750698 RepID=UPI0011607C2E